MTRDLRKYASRTNAGLALGAILVLTILGTALIWMLYGFQAAALGLVCVLAGLTPIAIIASLLQAADWIMKRAERG